MLGHFQNTPKVTCPSREQAQAICTCSAGHTNSPSQLRFF